MRKKRMLVLLVAVLMFMLSACSTNGNDVSRAYDDAPNAMKQGKYAEAVDKLAGISFYQDSTQLSLYCRAHAKAAEGGYDYAIEELEKLGAYRDAAQGAAYFTARKAEDTADDPYSRARAAWMYDQEKINGYRDSTARAAAIRTKLYEEGLKAQEAESWTEAADIFSALRDYQDSETRCHYASGRMYEADGERAGISYGHAAGHYNCVPDYLDSSDRKEQCIAAAYQKADQLIAAADKAADLKTATENLDGAEAIYQALGSLCAKDKLAKLDDARARTAEAERQRLIAKADALLAEKQFDEARTVYLQAKEQQKANEALYLKAAYLAEEGKPEDAAAQYREIFGYKDSREKHYLLGETLAETEPETASRILLNDRDYPGAEDALYEMARRASDEGKYSLSISIYSEFAGKKDCSLRMMNDLYLYGQQLLQAEDPKKAASVFDRLKGVGSADLYANIARYAAAESLEKNGSYEAAAKAYGLIEGYADAAERADNCRYQLAAEKKKNGQYQEAAEIFASLGSREDSAEQAKDCRYLQAGVYADRKDWEKAIEIYESLNDYSESKALYAECCRQLGEQQLEAGEAETAYQSFSSAGDAKGQSRAAYLAGEACVAEMSLEDALKWYQLAAGLPETEERTAMIAQNLLNMEEDSLSEEFASVVADSEKAKPVLYALALRSLERKDEEAAIRQMKKAGDNADASERFKAMINDRVEKLVAEEKYEEAIFLCNTYGEQERVEAITAAKEQKEEEARLKAEEANAEEHRAKAGEAEKLLKEGKYDEAAAVYTQIGETELAEKAIAEKEAAEEAVRAAEEAARLEAEKAEREKLQARLDEAAEKLAAGNYDDALQIYQEMNDREMVSEVIYQKAAALGQPELYLEIPEYRDSRELHYLAGKALLDTDPEKAYRTLADDIGYSDTRTVLYELADRQSAAGNYLLSATIFRLLADQPLDPAGSRSDCGMRATQDLYQYGLSLKEQGEYEQAADVFSQLSGLESAQRHAQESGYAIAEKLETDGNYTRAAVSFEALGDFSDAPERAKKNCYTAAEKLLEDGKYTQAEEAFAALDDYGDARQMVSKCRYLNAKQQMDAGKYEEAEDAFRALGEYEDAGTMRLECRYFIACGQMENGQHEKAIESFTSVGDYKDAGARISECYTALGDLKKQEAESMLDAGKTDRAAEAYQGAYEYYRTAGSQEKTDSAAYLVASCYQRQNSLSLAFDWYEKSGDAGKGQMLEIARYALITEQYDAAESLQKRIDTAESNNILYDLAGVKLAEGDTEEAIRLFGEAGDYSDAKTRHDELVYQKAEALSAEGRYTEAAEAYASLPGYKDADEKRNAVLYSYADALEKERKYSDAYDTFVSLGDYSDAAARAQILKSKLLKAGEVVRFGHYEQDNNTGNGSELIEWIVLEYNEAESKALLISKYGLDTVPYNKENKNTTWEKCTLRTWLNDDFLNTAFSAAEQSAILMTKVDNSKTQGYSMWNTDGGSNTEDRIFLLSYAEANRYLGVTNSNNLKSRVAPTAYALAHGAWTSDSNKTEDGAAAGWWWLRSPGLIQNFAAVVCTDGSLLNYYVDNDTFVVCPAFWINLESEIF